MEAFKVGLITSTAISELTRASCGPNRVQFASDTYAPAAGMVKSIVRQHPILHHAQLRAWQVHGGQALHDLSLLRVKTPTQSREPWDYC